jgi:capsular polysaccharide biosynthesis protein
MLSKLKSLSSKIQNRMGFGIVSEIVNLRSLADKSDWKGMEDRGRRILKGQRNAEVLALLAYSLQQQGHFEEAIQFAEESALLLPGQWLPHFTAGVSLTARSEFKRARMHLVEANKLFPTDLQTVRKLIEVVVRLDGVEVAAQEYILLLEKAGHSAVNLGAKIRAAQLQSVPGWCEANGVNVLDAGDIEQIPFKHPSVSGRPAYTRVFRTPSKKPYVAELKDARIFGRSNLILMPDGAVLNDDSCDPQFGDYFSFAYEKIVMGQESGKVLLDYSGNPEREIEAAVYLCGLGSASFGHWIPEYLPKLEFLMRHQNFARLPILVDAGMPTSHFDHIKRLVSNDLMLVQEGESIICRRLLVAPSPAFFPVEMFPHTIAVEKMPGLSLRAMRFVRGTEFKGSGQTRRLFLARKNMKWRRLLNEDEIAESLKSLGFETVYLEEKTAAEQMELFRNAEYIVAPNGSALLNVIFASTNTKLVVLTQPNLHNWGTFQGPIDELGYKSICVAGDYARSVDQKHSDYTVTVKDVRMALKALGLND